MAITLTRPESESADLSAEAQIYLDEMPLRKRFTRDEYHKLAEIGILTEGHGFELIEGDIVEYVPQKQPHTNLVMRWLFALARTFGEQFVWCQMPTVLSELSEPEPDVMVTSRANDTYLEIHETPTGDAVKLAVEVSVTSLSYDRTTKARLYAKGKIQEYWTVDVEARQLIVHRDPTPDGYATIVAYSETESVSPLAKPEATFLVSDYLP